MKKYLLHILLFFGIVAVVDFGFGYACVWLQIHAKGGRMKSVRQTALVQNADIVIMGSSRAHHHYVPSIIADSLGVSVYNAGVDGNGIVLALGLYELMTERYTPKLIIYDVEPAFDIYVYAEDGNNTRYIGWLRPYLDNHEIKKIVCRVDPMERYKSISSMFRYNSKIVDLLKDQVVVAGYRNDGYVELRGEMKTEPNIVRKEKPGQLDTLKLNMLEEFVKRISASDTRLIMVASPQYGAISSDAFVPIKSICERYGIDFWDYYYFQEFQKKEFFNEPMHLNDKGARTFSEIVSQRIIQTDKQ